MYQKNLYEKSSYIMYKIGLVFVLKYTNCQKNDITTFLNKKYS